MQDALDLQEAGCFAIVFEAIPTEVTDYADGADGDRRDRHRRRPLHRRPGARAARPARRPPRPRAEVRAAVRRRADGDAARASSAYAEAVRAREFPAPEHGYSIPPEELERLREQRRRRDAEPPTTGRRRYGCAPPWRGFHSCSCRGARVLRPLRGGRRRTSCAPPRLLEEMLESWPEKSELARRSCSAEQEGDRITHDIIHKLNATFVTPIDREDILALASGARRHRRLHRGGRRLPRASTGSRRRWSRPMELAKVLHQACRQIAEALPRLRTSGRHLALRRRDPPAGERRRPARARWRSPRCSSGRSTRWS